MAWMGETFERRVDPRALMGEARSIVMLGLNYGPEADPLSVLGRPEAGAISVYARGRDYHDVVKGKLKRLAAFLVSEARPDEADVKVFVDTAPLMEKPLAARAGLGWQGKHTNLVSREFGSWLFLGAILTDLELPPDPPEADHCGHCRACLDVCPTKAFPAPYQIDARRCISYLTIEHKGPIPRALRSAIGNRIYGCDDCLAVCPWNKFAHAGREAKLAARDDLDSPPLAELARLDDASFRALFAGSPIKRIGRARFLRNVLIADRQLANARARRGGGSLSSGRFSARARGGHLGARTRRRPRGVRPARFRGNGRGARPVSSRGMADRSRRGVESVIAAAPASHPAPDLRLSGRRSVRSGA